MIVVEKNPVTEVYKFTASVDSVYIERFTSFKSCINPLNTGDTVVSPNPIFVEESQTPEAVDTLVSAVTQYYSNLQN